MTVQRAHGDTTPLPFHDKMHVNDLHSDWTRKTSQGTDNKSVGILA